MNVPLNDSQMGIYLECVSKEQSTQYNVMFEYVFGKDTDAKKLQNACNLVFAHYAAFSACITLENGVPELARLEKAPEADFVPTEDAEYALLKAQYMRPFVLDRQPLVRATVFETENAVYLLTDIHHLITDGTSVCLFETALEKAYNGCELPAESYTLFDANTDENKHAESDEIKVSYDYFDHLLSGVETDSNMIPDVSGTDMDCCATLYHDLNVSAQDVKKLASANGLTENVVLLSAFAYALAKYTGQNEALFTSICNGRRGRPLGNTMGFFVRTFPLYFQFDENGSVEDWLSAVKKNYIDTLSHSDASFPQLAQRYGIRSDIKYVYQGQLINDFTFNGKTVKKSLQEWDDAKSNLDVMITASGDTYRLRLDYRKALYSEENIAAFAHMYSCVVRGMLSQKYLKDIELLSAEDRVRLDACNATEKNYDRSQTVWQILQQCMAQAGTRVAVNAQQRAINYAEFDQQTAKIASYLNAKGIGHEDFVAVLIPRNEYMPVTAWGVVRAGAAYQPLDPTYPQERLNFMVKDSGAKLLIADRNLRPLLDEYAGEVLYTDEIDELPAADFPPQDTPESALVIIYTSGTTGTPKGCVLENRNIVCFHHNHAENIGLDEESRVATYASFGFDAGIMDVFTTLMAGAALYVVPDEARLDIPRLNDFYKENAITHGFITTQVGRMFAELTDCSSLKTLLVGGEKLVPFNPPANFRVLNGYGPSETIAYVCHHQVCDASPIQPIGKPGGNIRLYVTDKYLRLLPVGACGELCIAGGQVGRGYLNRPEKTAEAFILNPFSTEEEYRRIYRTGDIVRWLPNGEMDFVGRRDGQVKIRGFRVELTEIEEVIRRYEGITDATVVACDEPGGGKYIAAYIVGNSAIDIQQLNAFIGGEKPSYMVPAVTMQLDAIPYNQNQKVNKRALPVPQRAVDAVSLQKPENEVQQQIYDIVRKILGHEDFGIVSNLFEVGLTSIGTLKLNVELGKAFDRAFRISDLKNHATVKELETFLNSGGEGRNYEKRDEYPLMQNQLGVLIESTLRTGSIVYNIPVLFRLSPRVDVQRLRRAVEEAVDAHPYIKTILQADAQGQYRAVRRDETEACVEMIRLQDLPAVSELVRPFRMLGEALYRICIYCTDGGNYLFMDVHHVLADGTSLGLLLSDINRAYGGEALEPERFGGFESALEEEKIRQSESYAKSEAYYAQLLESSNTDCLPARCPETSGTAGKKLSFSFGADSPEIIAFCRKNKCSLNAFFNAAFSHTLSLFLHADDVTYCTVYNGRSDSRLERSFAMLVKTLPVNCSLNPEEKVVDFVQKMQRQLLDSMANDAVSFAELSRKYALKADLFFTYQGDDFEFDTVCGEKAERLDLNFAEPKAPLVIEIFLKGSVFTAEVTYRTDCFCSDMVSSLTHSLQTAANGFVHAEKLKDVGIFSEAEKQHFEQMNDTDMPFLNLPAQRFIEQWAERTPDAVAVETASARLTFAELDRQATKLASSLIRLGVHAEDIIGLILERNEWIPVAEIGILKAGGAFLPMLPSYPDERLDFCLKDSGSRFVVTTKDIIAGRPELFSSAAYQVLSIEDLVEQGEASIPEIAFTPEQLAYCIYTSGSTGTPKGVMIEQHSFTNFVQTSPLMEIADAGHTLFCVSSISFDMSLCEFFFFLCRGKTVYIASDEEIHDFEKLFAAFENHGIDLAVMTPSFASNLLSLPAFGKVVENLKGFMLGAEAFPPALYTKLRNLNPDLLIQNGYGPTECTQGCAFKMLSSAENITIGGPFPNSSFYVMDGNGHLLPRYAVGELMICGECVGRGYVKLPEKNAAAFVQVEGMRAYHSGDLVRINRENEVEFGGRADNQVKLRGFRVELDEIEAVMQEFNGIMQSKVVVRNNGSEDYLAAFFTAASAIDTEKLLAFMKKKLTYYMLPAALMQLDKMPVTSNGKLDKKALPEIRPVKKTKSKRVPKKSLEEKVLEVFRSVLHSDDCGVDDNFFEIGGTSFSASNAVMQLKADGHSIEYQDIFDHQTAEELAAYLESLKSSVAQVQQAKEKELFCEDENISEMLKYNAMEYASSVRREPLGDVLLTGATGFLGNHVLKDLIDHEEGRIFCLMRKGDFESLSSRLKSMLFYYFEDRCEEAFKERIVLIEGDITDDTLGEKLKDVHFDTLINCAACVKHFSNDSSIEFVNVHGVENLIAVCKQKPAKMIQISTTSVPGVHNAESYRINLRMTEDRLFVIDDMNNQYCRSKYKAELLMLEAIRSGMRGKIIRVGNLMGRYKDGEFQINMRTNAFLNALRGFVAIGKCPISHSTDPMSFSPIDCTARAVVLLSGTNDSFTAFNADSRSTFDEAKLIAVVNRCGLPVVPVQDEEYYADFYRCMADPEQNKKVSALLTNDRPDVHVVNTDNRFTANVLYRLGFAWPFIDDTYLEKVIRALDSMGFFWLE